MKTVRIPLKCYKSVIWWNVFLIILVGFLAGKLFMVGLPENRPLFPFDIKVSGPSYCTDPYLLGFEPLAPECKNG